MKNNQRLIGYETDRCSYCLNYGKWVKKEDNFIICECGGEEELIKNKQ